MHTKLNFSKKNESIRNNKILFLKELKKKTFKYLS